MDIIQFGCRTASGTLNTVRICFIYYIKIWNLIKHHKLIENKYFTTILKKYKNHKKNKKWEDKNIGCADGTMIQGDNLNDKNQQTKNGGY